MVLFVSSMVFGAFLPSSRAGPLRLRAVLLAGATRAGAKTRVEVLHDDLFRITDCPPLGHFDVGDATTFPALLAQRGGSGRSPQDL